MFLQPQECGEDPLMSVRQHHVDLSRAVAMPLAFYTTPLDCRWKRIAATRDINDRPTSAATVVRSLGSSSRILPFRLRMLEMQRPALLVLIKALAARATCLCAIMRLRVSSRLSLLLYRDWRRL